MNNENKPKIAAGLMASAFLAMLPPSAEAAVKNGDHFEDCVPYLVEIYGHQIIDVLLATASKP